MAENLREWPYQFEVLPLNKLMVDDSYQRPMTTFVNRIVQKFDPALVGTLVVSKRNAREYAVVDGQTRMEALREVGETEAPCLVYLGLTVEDEASLFARLQKERRGIASYHRFRAALVAGEEEANEIEGIVKDTGYAIGLEKDEISAVAALEYAYRKDPDVLERVLLILAEAWGDEYVPAGDIIRGLAALLSEPKTKIEDERMADRLARVTDNQLRRRASALREGTGEGGGAVRYMRDALHAVYRKKA
jgi:hypothetical protein